MKIKGRNWLLKTRNSFDFKRGGCASTSTTGPVGDSGFKYYKAMAIGKLLSLQLVLEHSS